jgi:hypothetical protein
MPAPRGGEMSLSDVSLFVTVMLVVAGVVAMLARQGH